MMASLEIGGEIIEKIGQIILHDRLSIDAQQSSRNSNLVGGE